LGFIFCLLRNVPLALPTSIRYGLERTRQFLQAHNSRALPSTISSPDGTIDMAKLQGGVLLAAGFVRSHDVRQLGKARRMDLQYIHQKQQNMTYISFPPKAVAAPLGYAQRSQCLAVFENMEEPRPIWLFGIAGLLGRLF